MNVGNSLGLGVGTHLAASYPLFGGYRRGGCRLFYSQRYPTTSDSEMGFGTTLSFCFCCRGAGGRNASIMKKLLLIVCLLLSCGVVCAQSEHLIFKGLSIDGSKQEFVKELKRQGYVNVPEMGNDDILSGTFIGQDSYVFVGSTPITNIMWKVGVLFKTTYDTWSLIKETYDGLVDVYTQKYGNPVLEQKDFKAPWKEGDGHELIALKSDMCAYKTMFAYAKNGTIIGYIAISMTTACQILIQYEDSINTDLLTKEKAQEI